VREKVLIIEDDPVLSSIVSKYLSDRGFETLNAGDGKTGISLCDAKQPDVVLCDLGLPEVSGLKVLEHILRSHQNIPVIVISASSSMSDIREAVRLGAVDYMVKPLDKLDLLEAAVRSCLNRRDLEMAWEQERWELDDHIDVLFDEPGIVEQLTQDLIPHEDLQVGRYLIQHHMEPGGGQQFWMDYHKLTDDTAIVLMAKAQASMQQNVLSLLVLKTLFSPLLRLGLAERHRMLQKPHQLADRLNLELCQSRIRAAFDFVALFLDGKTGEIAWAHGGDNIELSISSRNDMALGIWNKAVYLPHSGQVPEDGLTISSASSKIYISRLRSV